MSLRVGWSKAATKQLLDIPKKQRLMILKWVEDNLVGCANPKAIPGCKQLQGTTRGWRYGVGSYRILASVFENSLLIEVVRVGHRQGVYKNLPKDI